MIHAAYRIRQAALLTCHNPQVNKSTYRHRRSILITRYQTLPKCRAGVLLYVTDNGSYVIDIHTAAGACLSSAAEPYYGQVITKLRPYISSQTGLCSNNTRSVRSKPSDKSSHMYDNLYSHACD